MSAAGVFVCYLLAMICFLIVVCGFSPQRLGEFRTSTLGLAFWLLPALWTATEAAF